MKRIIFTFLILTASFTFAQTAANKIFTDFNTFWESGVQGAPIPNNSHNLLGFKIGNTVYSTGVNDTKLSNAGIVFSAQNFSALPITANPNASGSTYIGVGKMYGGDGNINPIPVSQPLSQYLGDGTNGLDLGTAIFNFPSSSEINYEIEGINLNSIGDGVPDLLITQMGQISNVQDRYSFRNSAGTVIGNEFNVNLSTINSIGLFRWKFYNSNINPPTYNTVIGNTDGNNTRDVRILALDWADLGINTSNAHQVSRFVQIFSGQSDLSFTAYNKVSISLRMPISGIVFKDNNGGSPNGLPAANASLSLKNSAGVIVATTSTDSNGFYAFNNVLQGDYTINLSIPAGYQLVGNIEGTLSNSISAQVVNSPIQNRNFGIYRLPCVKPGSTGTPTHYANFGILVKKEVTLSGWPKNVPSAHIVMDSETKGFVITHMTSVQRNAMSPVEGMMIYNTDLKCVQLYRGSNPGVDTSRSGWVCINRGCNEE